MIISEYLNDGKIVFYYSDLNVMLKDDKTGNLYSSAIINSSNTTTFSETDIPVIDKIIKIN